MHIKKYLLTVFLLFFVFSTCHAQSRIYFDKSFKVTTKENASYYRLSAPKGPYFYIKDFYITGELQFEGLSKTQNEPFVLMGSVKWYYKNGKVSSKANYINGKINGETVVYYSDGTIRTKSNYYSDSLNGNYTSYLPWGDIKINSTYSKNQLNGPYQSYNIFGHKEMDIFFKDGFLDGNFNIFYRFGNIQYKGQAKQHKIIGKCLTYFEHGGIKREFSIENGFLNGSFMQLNDEGDTISKAYFKNGMPIYYFNKIKNYNGSEFLMSLLLKDGIENWKVYRDSILVMEYFFKDGNKMGIWKLKSYDGKYDYATIDYSLTSCKETYLQPLKATFLYFDVFDPYISFGNRFNINSILNDINCNPGVIVKNENEVKDNFHPIDHIKGENMFSQLFGLDNYKVKKEGNQGFSVTGKRKLVEDVHYRDPIIDSSFISRNGINTIDTSLRTKVKVFSRNFGKLKIYICISHNRNELIKFHSNAVPKTNEAYFYYQSFEETLLLKGSITPDRLMLWRLPETMKEAINSKVIEDLDLIKILEYDIFEAKSFSGSQASDALKNELIIEPK